MVQLPERWANLVRRSWIGIVQVIVAHNEQSDIQRQKNWHQIELKNNQKGVKSSLVSVFYFSTKWL